jgi:hypothetical protein
MQRAIDEATDASSRTATHLFWRTGQILKATHQAGEVQLPSQRSLYRLLAKLSAGSTRPGRRVRAGRWQTGPTVRLANWRRRRPAS